MYHLSWLIDKRVLYLKIDGATNLPELESMSLEICDYLDVGDAPVHLVADVSTWKFEMFNVLKLRDALKHHMDRPEIGWITVYGNSNAFLQFLAATITQLAQKRYNLCDSLEDSLAHLHDFDRTLAGLPVRDSEIEFMREL